MTKEKDEAVKHALELLNKKLGKGTVMRMGDKPSMKVEVIPSGSFALDDALGVGGYPKGRILEIYGPESSGKTTMALHAIAEAQKLGLNAAFVDAEHALDPVYANNLGVNIDDMIISQPDCGEDALEVVDGLVRSSGIDIIVVDSVAALTPRAELSGDMGDSHMGLQARLMSQALRKLTGAVSQSGCIVIFINQIRMKIGVMFGNPETTTGGNALKFYASVRLDVRRRTAIKKGDQIIGNETTVKVVKNKVAPPFRIAEIKVLYGKGISRPHQLVQYGEQLGLIDKGGAWFTVPDLNIKLHGEAALIEEIESNELLKNFLEDNIKGILAGKDKVVPKDSSVEEPTDTVELDSEIVEFVHKAIEDGRVTKKGPWLYLEGTSLKARGEAAFIEVVQNDEEAVSRLKG